LSILVIKTIISELRIFAQLYDKNLVPTMCIYTYTPSITTLFEGQYDISSRSI